MSNTSKTETNTGPEQAVTTTQEIRDDVASRVEKMDAQAAAMDAQLELEPEQAKERLDEQKQRVEAAAQQINDAVAQTEVPAQEAADPLRAAFEQLQVQLALGWAEGRDAYAAQKKKIQDSIGAFEAEADRASAAVDQKTREALDGLKREFVAQADTLDAELTAVEVQYVEEKDKVKAEWASQKQAVEEQIEKFKAELEAKGQAASEKLEKFEGELTDGLSQLKKAFTNLFS